VTERNPSNGRFIKGERRAVSAQEYRGMERIKEALSRFLITYLPQCEGENADRAHLIHAVESCGTNLVYEIKVAMVRADEDPRVLYSRLSLSCSLENTDTGALVPLLKVEKLYHEAPRWIL
jgi:hypothetical protein